MTAIAGLLVRVVCLLTQADIPHMVVGSIAAGAHGKMRSTWDIDIVIDPTAKQLAAFVDSVGEGYYLSDAAAREAMAQRGMFNLIDHGTGAKVDLILLKRSAYARQAFARRFAGKAMGVDVQIQAVEDTILSKLAWAKRSGSERQVEDAVGVAALQWPTLDRTYLAKWAEELGLADLLEEVLSAAEKLQ